MKKLSILIVLLAVLATKASFAQVLFPLDIATKASFAQVSFPLDIDSSPLSLDESNTGYFTNDPTYGYLIPSFFYGTTSYGTGWTVESALSGSLPSGVTLDLMGVSVTLTGIDPADDYGPDNSTIVNGSVDINLGELDWSLYQRVSIDWTAFYSDGGYDFYTQTWDNY